MKISIGLVDDHQLFLKSLSLLISSRPIFDVVVEALNGEALFRKLEAMPVPPDIVLLDVNMPVMGGLMTAQKISATYPAIKMAALSMKDDDSSIINMLKAGCCAYLMKDIHPEELERALLEINTKGSYNADMSNINYRRLILAVHGETALKLSEKEKIFLQLASSDLTYKQVAAAMHLSERTIDGYRESVFEKLNVQSRVGMVLEGIRRNLVVI